MGLFAYECIYCGSKEHASEDCPHGTFSSKKCIHCSSIEHASEQCPHGTFSSKKCIHCGSKEHASEDCPHGTFASKKCIYCGGIEHASEQCPHGTFSSKKCIYCGSKEHASENCPHRAFGNSTSTTTDSSSSDEKSGEKIIGWIIGVVIVVFIVIWLAVNVVLPVVLLNSALALTVFAIIKKERKILFAILALVGGGYMFIDIANGWLSANFVNNVVKNNNWITAFTYINSAAIGLSTWFIVSPLWSKAQLAYNLNKAKTNEIVNQESKVESPTHITEEHTTENLKTHTVPLVRIKKSRMEIIVAAIIFLVVLAAGFSYWWYTNEQKQKYFVRDYNGNFKGHPIKMTVVRQGYLVTGIAFMQQGKVSIQLSGTIDGDNNFVLYDAKKVYVYKGKFFGENSLSGAQSSIGNKKSYNFFLQASILP